MNLNNQVVYANNILALDLFGGLYLPSPFDLDTAKSVIMQRCGLLTPVYSEPKTMYDMIANWSVSMQWNFSHLAKLIQVDYEPLENYDRIETETTTDGENLTIAKNSGETTTNTISAENSGTYQPDRQSVVQESGSDTHSRTGNGARNLRAHGNIGVTTSQQMALSEKDLITQFNAYRWIAEQFEKEFCIMIY